MPASRPVPAVIASAQGDHLRLKAGRFDEEGIQVFWGTVDRTRLGTRRTKRLRYLNVTHGAHPPISFWRNANVDMAPHEGSHYNDDGGKN